MAALSEPASRRAGFGFTPKFGEAWPLRSLGEAGRVYTKVEPEDFAMAALSETLTAARIRASMAASNCYPKRIPCMLLVQLCALR
jgi:hypothetical protein